MLDRLTVHVEYVDRAVGRVHELRRPEPVVARREEFVSLGPVGTLGAERLADSRQPFAVDEVAADVADEEIAAKLVAVRVSTVNEEPGCRGEKADGDQLGGGEALLRVLRARPPAGAHDAPGFRRTRTEDGGRTAVDGKRATDRRRRQPRISREVVLADDDVTCVIGVAAREPMAEVVEAHSELPSGARDTLERFAGAKAKIAGS